MNAGYFTIDEQIACLKREVHMRERLYPRWVAMQKMTQPKADSELGAMRAALATLERVSVAAHEAELRRAGG